MFRTLHPNIKIRIYTSFLSRIVGSAIFPFMAIYFTTRMNASIAGVLVVSQVFIQFITGLYGGHLADLVGRKQLMVAGEVIKVGAFIGMLLVNSPWLESAWLTYVMMLLVGVSGGLVNPAAEAMLIDVSTKETRSFMYAVNYWAVNFSIMIGLSIGGWFFEDYLFELLIVLMVLSLLTLWMTVTFIIDTYVVTSEKSSGQYGLKPLLKSYGLVCKDLSFLAFTLGGVAILAIEFQRNNYISVRLERDIQPMMVDLVNIYSFQIDGIKLLSLLTITNTLIIVLFTAIVSKWIKGRDEQSLMYAGFILFGAGYAFMAFSTHLPGLFLAVVVLSIGELLYVPTRQAMLAEVVDDSRRGAYMAFNGLVFQLGKMLGGLGLIIGNIIGGVGMSVLYLLLVCAGIFFTKLALHRHKIHATNTVEVH
ncbi:MDR family MFS transporter [Pseudalkalibacillus hwajinpoensis]|uniref:MFS transporter n=1 Tax=Guptibacillus hwajinpoensis TaxID=208199 RepID=A0A4U1MMG9_9BACL|nr:MFS transporter [Pseudalkalibacillus hwajinpoensis]TKD72147.1 MFS transporter [Pseudalkalibacillus hwajinpoensis]